MSWLRCPGGATKTALVKTNCESDEIKGLCSAASVGCQERKHSFKQLCQQCWRVCVPQAQRVKLSWFCSICCPALCWALGENWHRHRILSSLSRGNPSRVIEACSTRKSGCFGTQSCPWWKSDKQITPQAGSGSCVLPLVFGLLSHPEHLFQTCCPIPCFLCIQRYNQLHGLVPLCLQWLKEKKLHLPKEFESQMTRTCLWHCARGQARGKALLYLYPLHLINEEIPMQ